MSTPAPYPAAAPIAWRTHLRELRTRFLIVSTAIAVGTALGYGLTHVNDAALLTFIARWQTPPGTYVQAQPPLDAVSHVLRVAVALGIVLAMPMTYYQVLAFLAPSLTGRTRRQILLCLPLLMLCFLGGLIFAWRVTVPATLNFLLEQGGGTVLIQPTAASFFSLVTRLMLLNGVIFGVPATVWALVRLGVRRSALAQQRRYALLTIIGFCALLIPTTDPINLAFITLPTYLLYELGLLLALLVPPQP